MKQISPAYVIRTFAVFMLLIFAAFMAFAQETTGTTSTQQTTSTTVTTEEVWYMQPWAWVVGGVVVLILLISLFRGSSKTTDSVTYTKTVKRDED